eukprot:1383356-Amphidinium_carterae.1
MVEALVKSCAACGRRVVAWTGVLDPWTVWLHFFIFVPICSSSAGCVTLMELLAPIWTWGRCYGDGAMECGVAASCLLAPRAAMVFLVRAMAFHGLHCVIPFFFWPSEFEPSRYWVRPLFKRSVQPGFLMI